MAKRRSVEPTGSQDPGFRDIQWGRLAPPRRDDIGPLWLGAPPSPHATMLPPGMHPGYFNGSYFFKRNKGKLALGGFAVLAIGVGAFFGNKALNDVDTCTTHPLVGENGQKIEFCVEKNAVIKVNGVISAEVTVKAGESASTLGNLDSSMPTELQSVPVRSSAFILQTMLSEGRVDGSTLCQAENQEVINLIKNSAGYYENFSETDPASVREEEIAAATTIQLFSRVTLPGSTEPTARVLGC